MLKKVIKNTLASLGLLEIVRRIHPIHLKYKRDHRRKENAILEFQKQLQIHILIETGTYTGQMIEAMRDYFEKIYSIELDKDLYDKALERFKSEKKIKIYNGDSGKLLPGILAEITEPCIFWLDAHYSSGITARGDIDTPIVKELETILTHSINNHVILIDDARLFIGEDGYPTIPAIREMVESKKSGYQVLVLDDIVRIYPATA